MTGMTVAVVRGRVGPIENVIADQKLLSYGDHLPFRWLSVHMIIYKTYGLRWRYRGRAERDGENARSIKLSFLRPQRRTNGINIIRKTIPLWSGHGGVVCECVPHRCSVSSVADWENVRQKTNSFFFGGFKIEKYLRDVLRERRPRPSRINMCVCVCANRAVYVYIIYI